MFERFTIIETRPSFIDVAHQKQNNGGEKKNLRTQKKGIVNEYTFHSSQACP